MEYPPGALRTLSEIEALMLRVRAGEVVKVYPVTIKDRGNRMTPAASDLTSARVLKLNNKSRGLMCEIENSVKVEFDLDWRGIDVPDDIHSGYLFTNYWLAYAFFLMQGKHNAKKPNS